MARLPFTDAAGQSPAILRGRWVRERLLGGGVPDVPITVDRGYAAG